MARKLFLMAFASASAFFALILLATFVAPRAFHAMNNANAHAYIEYLLRRAENDLSRADTSAEIIQEERAAAQQEIERYQSAPHDYLAILAEPEANAEGPPAAQPPASQPPVRVLLRTSHDVRHLIEQGYRHSMSVLIEDLQIISGSNVCMLCLALLVVYYVRSKGNVLALVLALFVIPCVAVTGYIFHDVLGDPSFRIAPIYPLCLVLIVAATLGYVAIQYGAEAFVYRITTTPGVGENSESESPDGECPSE